MADAEALKELTGKHEKLDERVRSLETYLKIGIAVGVLLGISGGWLGKVIGDAKHEVDRLGAAVDLIKPQVEQAKSELEKSKHVAIQDLRSRAEQLAPEVLRGAVKECRVCFHRGGTGAPGCDAEDGCSPWSSAAEFTPPAHVGSTTCFFQWKLECR